MLSIFFQSQSQSLSRSVSSALRPGRKGSVFAESSFCTGSLIQLQMDMELLAEITAFLMNEEIDVDEREEVTTALDW